MKALQKLFKLGKVVFIPQCNGDGGYDDIQCYKGICWCTNNRGTEMPGTRIRGKPNCKNPGNGRITVYYQIIAINSWQTSCCLAASIRFFQLFSIFIRLQWYLY